MDNTVVGPKVFERFGTFDDSEQRTQIESFSSAGQNKIHPAKRKALLANDPFLLVLPTLPREMLWKLLVCVFPGLTTQRTGVRIGFKKCSQAGTFSSCALKNLLRILVQIESAQMLPG